MGGGRWGTLRRSAPRGGTSDMRRTVHAVPLLGAAALLACTVLAGCSPKHDTIERAGSSESPSASTSAGVPTVSPSADPSSADPSSYAVADPGHLKGRLYTSDVLVTSSR